jgi:hypothetical protein
MFEELAQRSLIYAATAPGDPSGTSQNASQAVGIKQWTTVVKRALLGGDAGLFGGARLPSITN